MPAATHDLFLKLKLCIMTLYETACINSNHVLPLLTLVETALIKIYAGSVDLKVDLDCYENATRSGV